MANSKYEYVKSFERPDNLLPNTWIVIRLDGRGFHKFSARHNFSKPNDPRAISLMNHSATLLLRDLPELLLAYGVSDEFSFLLSPQTTLFERREAKLTSTIVSTFTAYYVHHWPTYFPTEPLKEPLPSFDARAVCYPSVTNVRDYFSWRQVDCHINNLYNTVFWALVVKGGLGRTEAESRLKGTLAKEKNEILWGLGVNYNCEEEKWRKGSVVFRELKKSVEVDATTATETTTPTTTTTTPADKNTATAQPSDAVVQEGDGEDDEGDVPPGKILRKKKTTKKQAKKEQKRLLKAAEVVVRHIDIIEDAFWNEHPSILGEGME
ncbi:tRNAHis guanylyltransferase [Terfezia boudieri ATCC MYA-4762]|uniref:tRNA(His) guanylyltransferase n=1 Tax=Terfezia boudieri ATCC MYA-4762 TaxID=1051890 RepID=A0A3N4M7X8_9PEZI|nr:tRNAHis guanylyltransferase [Terfezia boudieri ATCC MYA-4762]